ncbi:MAG: LysE family transporter [Anaerolineales bacterium]
MDTFAGESLLSFFLQGTAIGVSAALSPGPFQSLIIAQSLHSGWRRAVPITFAPLLADIPIGAVLVFAMSQVPAGFLRFVHFAGAALLVYLAWSLWKEMRAKKSKAKKKETTHLSPLRAFSQGVLMLFLSPGPYLFWALVNGPILLRSLDNSLVHSASFLIGFYTFSIGGLIVIAYVLSRIGELSERGRRALQMGSLVLMIAIAALLVFNGVRA